METKTTGDEPKKEPEPSDMERYMRANWPARLSKPEERSEDWQADVGQPD